MTPEQIVALSDAEREFTHTTRQGWVLRARIPTRSQVRQVVRSTGNLDDLTGLAEKLALGAVLSWQNVTLADVGLSDDMVGVDPKAAAPCTPRLVDALLGDRLDVLDAYREDFVARMNARTKALEDDEKKSVSA